jgi:hypothetical protein
MWKAEIFRSTADASAEGKVWSLCLYRFDERNGLQRNHAVAQNGVTFIKVNRIEGKWAEKGTGSFLELEFGDVYPAFGEKLTQSHEFR